NRNGWMISGGEPNRAGRLLPKLIQSRQLRLDFFEPRSHGIEEALARLRRRDTTGGAREKANAEPFLEPPHGVTESGGRYTELCGSPGEAAAAGDEQEGLEVVEILACHY